MSYRASFTGAYGSKIENAPIPPHLVEHFAGEHWVRFQIRESIAAIDNLLTNQYDGELGIDAADLILRFQGKIYPTYRCFSVTGNISCSSLASIRHAVRSRVLELTLELEKSVPDATSVILGPAALPSAPNAAAATQITQQIIYGNYTSIAATGNGATIQVTVVPHNEKSLADYLTHSGMAEEDALELARLATLEQPESKIEPMGPEVKGWLVDNLKKAASGTWKMGLSVATDIIKEALLKYYGLN